MPYPTLTELPQAASRISDSGNFVSESIVFLNALPNWKTQTNAYNNYINSLNFKYDDYGLVSNATPAFINVNLIGDLPSESTTPFQNATLLDGAYSKLKSFSANQNGIGSFLDNTITLFGVGPVDISKPLLPTINSLIPSRLDNLVVFESRAKSFTEEAKSYTNSLNVLYSYVYNIIYLPENYGLVDEPVDSVVDLGLI